MSGKMNESGISTVVGLILILGLIVSVAAVVKLTYIPDVKKQLEADHMQQVIRDIQTFKAQLDLDQAAASTGVGYVANANIEMGGGAIPGIDPSTSTGTLSLDPAYGRLTITAYEYPSGVRLDLGSATAIGRLAYQSNNRYFADQNLSYECGMITLAQPGGSVMLTPPSVIITSDSAIEGRPIVSVNALRLNGIPQTFSSGGTGMIRTWLMPGSTAYASKNVTNVTFTIVSDNAPLWYSYLSDSLAASGLATNNYQLARPDAETVTLRINGTGTQNTGLYLADSSFGAAMGYGNTVPGLPTITPTPGPTPTPTPTPSPTPVPTPTPLPTTIQGSGWETNGAPTFDSGYYNYTMDVILQVTNMESQTAFGVFATCVPPVETNGLRNIRLVSAASPNPMDIPAWTYPRYVWRYTFEIKNGRTATFSLGAVGTNTNQVNTTVSFTA